jgi:hypothetical protein
MSDILEGDEELPMNEFTVMCHTVKCKNADIPIEVNAFGDSPNIVCGLCGVQITDISLVEA